MTVRCRVISFYDCLAIAQRLDEGMTEREVYRYYLMVVLKGFTIARPRLPMLANCSPMLANACPRLPMLANCSPSLANRP
jgi:hypothetical protein